MEGLSYGVVVKRYVDGSEIPIDDNTAHDLASKISYQVEIPIGGPAPVLDGVAPQRSVRWPDEVPGASGSALHTFPFEAGTAVVLLTVEQNGLLETFIVAPRELPYFDTCDNLNGGGG